MRKETKIGLFALITLAMAIWGYQYLKGFNILSPKTTIYVISERVDGVRISTPVQLNGLQVGLVASIKQARKDLRSLIIMVELDREMLLPKSTIANITTTSLMGGTAINLEFEGTCSGQDCLVNGDTISGNLKGLLASMADPEEVGQYVRQLNEGLQDVIDTLSSRLKHSEEIQQGAKNVQAILANLHSTTDRLDQLMAGSVKRSAENLETITTTLRNSNEQIKAILDNAAALTTDLKEAKLDEVATETKDAIRQLRQTLTTSEKAIGDLEAVLSKVKNGEGAVGMLLNDEQFAKNVQLTVKHVELLLQDIRLHPERYRRILSKKKLPYKQTDEDPGLR